VQDARLGLRASPPRDKIIWTSAHRLSQVSQRSAESGSSRRPNEDHLVQRAHYESVRDACIAELDLLDDEFYRGFAAHQIIDMCIAAGDIAVARTLLVSVTDDFLRQKIFETAPALKV
jgi:hypothetical protein